jgi:hypothetical protein
MKHGVANDAEVANGRGPVTEGAGLSRRSRRQSASKRAEFGN